MRLTGKLNHIKPANRMLVAAINRLENAVVGTEGSLGRNMAHAQEHLEDVGKTVGLVEVVGGTLVQGPLGVVR